MSEAITLEMFNKTIASISKAQASASKAIGAAALMALYFANAKGDAGAASALVACLRSSTKKESLIALLETHGNLAVKKGKLVSFVPFAAGKVWAADDVKTLRTVCEAWESFKAAEKEVVAFDLAEALDKLLKRAEKAQKDGVTVIGAAMVKDITAVSARFHSELVSMGLTA